MLTDLVSVDDYIPDPTNYNFIVGDGLMIYAPKGAAIEMFAALSKGDVPPNPSKGIREQWAYLAEQGFHTVYAVVKKEHFRSNFMCKAIGMELHSNKQVNLYTKVIYGQ